MIFLRIIAVLCLCATAWGQGSRFDSNVFTSALNVPPGAKSPMYTMPFAQIRVCAYPATIMSPNAMCTNQVNIYSDPGLTQLVKQPFLADAQGRFGFWAAPGQYAYSVVGSGQYLGTYNFSLSGPGGGQATFPSSPGVVWSLSTSSARNATGTDISGLFSGSSPCALMKDGTCATISSGGVTSITADPANWPTWLVPHVDNPTGSASISAVPGPIPNTALANSSVTINSTSCALGTGCTIPLTGVSSINSNPGPFTFTFSGGAGSCTGTTCNFTGGGMVYPAAGIANSTGSTWGTPYSATNAIPATFLPSFGTAAAGIVPLSGGGTTNFLRADGTWAAPPGGGGTNPTVNGLQNWNTSAWAAATSANVVAVFGSGTCSGYLKSDGSCDTPGAGISNVAVTLPTGAILANTCTSAVTATMTGLTTSSAFSTAFATDPSTVNGWGSTGGLTFVAWPTADTLNWRVCNVTAATITPGAMTLNVGAK